MLPDKIISSNQLNQQANKKIDDWIEKVKQKLSDFSVTNQTNVAKLGTIFQDIERLFPKENIKSLSTFLLKNVQLIKAGSYSYDSCTASGDHFTIDLVLVVPQSCWQGQDHRDYIYHRKRATYLFLVSKYFEGLPNLISTSSLQPMNGNHLKPVIIVKPAGKLGLYCRFRFLLAPERGKCFVESKLQPAKCHLRLDDNDAGSPKYNASILEDISLGNELPTISNSSNVSGGLVLLRVWLERRHLRHFAHVLSLFTLHLIRSKQILATISSFQIFKSVIDKLSISQWDKEGQVLHLTDNPTETDEAALCQEFLNYFDVVVIDAQSGLNLCHNVSVDQYERLRFDAKLTSELIGKNVAPSTIFQSNADFYTYFDYFISIPLKLLKNAADTNAKKVELADNGCDYSQVMIPRLLKLFKNAVADRVLLIQHNHVEGSPSKTKNKKTVTDKDDCGFIIFGILVNKDKSLDLVTKGPSADSPQASEFQTLWKDKAEIRRFQNGDICEAVFWACDNEASRRCIVFNAIKFILSTQLQMKLHKISSSFGVFDHLLQLKNIKFDDDQLSYGTGEYFISLAQEKMNLLKKQVHGLNNLSFSIVEVLGVDAIARSTEVFPMAPFNSKPRNVKYSCNLFSTNIIEDKIKHVKPYNLIVKVELDSKLITDLVTLKAQLYLLYAELSNELRKVHNYAVNYYCDHLDVFVDGHVFRLVLTFNKQLTIYQHSLKNKTSKDVSKEDVETIEFLTEVLPTIASCLSVYSQENYAFALTCRLFKRWLSMQMIKGFFDDLTIDLLVAYVFFHHSTIYPIPNSHISGFLRVLKFITEFDFVNTPMFMNFNNIMSSERMTEIEKRFYSERSTFPIIFLVTSYDHKLSYHSRNTNGRVVAHLQKLASSAQHRLVSSFSLGNFANVNCLKPQMNKFDVIIELDPKMITNKYQSIDFPATITLRHTLYKEGDVNAMPITDYNPVYHYLDQLRKSYANVALFFYDEFGGREIGVLLKPGATESNALAASTTECVKVSAGNAALNVEALLEDFQILGASLVSKITLKS